VSRASRVLGLSDELVKHALSYFDTGAPTPAGVLKLAPEASFAEQDRTKERLKAEAGHGGVLVVQGDATYEQTAARMDNSQFVEQRRLAAQEVARVFRLPPHMLDAPSADSMTKGRSGSAVPPASPPRPERARSRRATGSRLASNAQPRSVC
jgi:phage portal protein BeeE